MNCETSKDYIMKYFDGELNNIEEAQFKQHLKICPDCGSEFRCMQTIFTAIKTKAEIEPPADFETRVMDRVASIEKKEKKKGQNASYGYTMRLLCFLSYYCLYTWRT